MSKHKRSGDEPSLGGQPQPKSGDDVRLGGDAALLHLIASLNHSDPVVRKRVAFKLAGHGHVRAYDALMRLYDEADHSLHRSILQALGKLGDPRAVDLLIQCLANQDETQQVRIAAAEALGMIGDSRAVEPLITQLEFRQRNSNEFNKAVVFTLIKIGDSRAIPALLALVPHSLVRRHSPRFVDDLVIEKILDFHRSVKRDQSISDLIQLAKNGERGARNTLYLLRDPRAVPELLIILRSAFEDDVNYEAFLNSYWWVIEALGYIATPEAVDTLFALLERIDIEKSDRMAEKIINALGESRDIRMVKPLLAYFDSSVYWHVADALVEIRDSSAVKPMIQLLRQARDLSDADREEACVYVLGYLGDPTTLGKIAGSLHSKNEYVRGRAAAALGRLGVIEALEPLLNALQDEDESVREDAVKAIAKYYVLDERAPQAIISALNDEERAIRDQAARILGEHHEIRAVNALIARLMEEEGWVYRTTRTALRRIGTPEALAAIEATRRAND